MHVMTGSTYILHSSETCQYNSNVLTLCGYNLYVAGLIVLVKIDWLGLQSLQPTSACGTLKMKDPMTIVIPLHCNVIAKWAM